MSDEQAPKADLSQDAENKGMYLLLLIISDPPLSRLLKALDEYREAVKREVS